MEIKIVYDVSVGNGYVLASLGGKQLRWKFDGCSFCELTTFADALRMAGWPEESTNG